MRTPLALIAAAVLCAACTTDEWGPGTGPVVPPPGPVVPNPVTNTVPMFITDDGFSPQEWTVARNQLVSWTNRGTLTHSVTMTTIAWSTGPIAPGSANAARFTSAGTYTYMCAFHQSMTGTLTVQ